MSQEQVTKELGERRKNPAYRNGWGDGRFGPTRLFLENSNLAKWSGHQERLSYAPKLVEGVFSEVCIHYRA